MDESGTLYFRKNRGHKLNFLIGGPSFESCLDHCFVTLRGEHYVWVNHADNTDRRAFSKVIF